MGTVHFAERGTLAGIEKCRAHHRAERAQNRTAVQRNTEGWVISCQPGRPFACAYASARLRRNPGSCSPHRSACAIMTSSPELKGYEKPTAGRAVDLVNHYGVPSAPAPALRGVPFTVPPGERVALLGKSG